jgi:hypothetical protein
LKYSSAIVAIGLCVLCATLFTPTVYPQEAYWTGLNLELRFGRAGSVLVTLNLHPFDQQGRSLISYQNVTDQIISEENSTIETALLLFSATTKGVNYTIVSHSKVDMNKSVFCNLGFSEGMKTFKGAITVTFEVMLNTTTSLTRISDDRYQVVITDFYTASDPQSWIDAINFTFTDGITLLNYSSAPPWAKPPRTADADHLGWVNENEMDAPDYYVFTLSIPDVVFSRAAAKLEGKISQAQVVSGQSALSIKVSNTGQAAGTFIVRVLEGAYDQARKVSLSSGEDGTIELPLHTTGGTAQVSLIADGSIIDQSEVQIGVGLSAGVYTMIKLLGYGLVMVGLASLVLHLLDREGARPTPVQKDLR